MMSTTAPQPVTTPIPVQLSEPEFDTFILPHLSMPKRGPKCKLGYYRVFNLICNRSPYENRNHAAACDCISQAGRRDGAASPCRAASWAAVR